MIIICSLLMILDLRSTESSSEIIIWGLFWSWTWEIGKSDFQHVNTSITVHYNCIAWRSVAIECSVLFQMPVDNNKGCMKTCGLLKNHKLQGMPHCNFHGRNHLHKTSYIWYDMKRHLSWLINHQEFGIYLWKLISNPFLVAELDDPTNLLRLLVILPFTPTLECRPISKIKCPDV